MGRKNQKFFHLKLYQVAHEKNPQTKNHLTSLGSKHTVMETRQVLYEV